MITSSRLLLGFIALATSLTVGCAADEGDSDGAESSEDAVIGGSTTFERPEIGVVLHRGMCTGTLVRPNVVITAMHCGTGTPVDADVTASDPRYFFEIRKSETEKHRFKVVRAESIAQPADFDGTQKWRDKDILMLKLESDVPAEIAKPANIATQPARIGSKVAVYGYGCTSRVAGEDGRRPGGGTKRKKEYWWNVYLAFGWSDTQNVCPGDSGGPLLDVQRNAVFGTNSGYVGGVNGNDQFGDVPAASAKLNELADRWASHR
jgi:V8-like Glu-specific endopeptidase